MTKCICVILYIVMVVLSDVGERVRLVRKLLNLTQKEFADRLGLSRSLIAEIEAGRRQPKERTLRLIAYTFRISFTWLKEGKGEIFVKHDEVEEVELIKLPVISAVGAGGAMYTSDYELVVRSSIPHDRLKAFRVKGDSMEPTIQDGWLVVIDEEDKELQDGRIYLIAEQNNGLRIRRLRKVDGVCKVDDGLYRELKKVADMNSEKLSDLVSYILKTALLGECVYIDSELYEKLVEKCHGHVDVMITVNKLLEAFVNNKVVIKEVL